MLIWTMRLANCCTDSLTEENGKGHWGWRIEQVLEKISEWMETYKPDVILLHLGTNNLAGGDDVQPAVGLLSSLVCVR